jgi:release factor glutamine methyltransferase
MQSVLEILSLCTTYLKERGVINPRRQAEELMSDALGIDRLQLYMNFERPLTEGELVICRERLIRRTKGEPLQYIRGHVDFYDCSILVSPAVLIPRQETEILVDKIVNYLKKQDIKEKSLWDVCCGSGCIGIALKKHFPNLEVYLSDVSPEALSLAAQNAERNGVKVHLKEGDLLTPFKGQKAHFLTCNPPYVKESEYVTLDREVQRHEPQLALVAGQRGIEFYERLAQELPGYLYPRAAVWFEIGQGQGEEVKALFKEESWKNQQVENDWAGHNRFFFLENE